jgi:hypothetical protein
MSKKFKSQASSSRAAAGGFGAFAGSFGGFSTVSASHSHAPSSLSYVTEPPDLSRISEPQLVVAFKNLLKKDDTTKTKALEDVRDYILKLENRSDSLEDGVLDAWVRRPVILPDGALTDNLDKGLPTDFDRECPKGKAACAHYPGPSCILDGETDCPLPSQSDRCLACRPLRQ